MSDDDILGLIRKLYDVLEQKDIIQSWLQTKFPEAFHDATSKLTTKK